MLFASGFLGYELAGSFSTLGVTLSSMLGSPFRSGAVSGSSVPGPAPSLMPPLLIASGRSPCYMSLPSFFSGVVLLWALPDSPSLPWTIYSVILCTPSSMRILQAVRMWTPILPTNLPDMRRKCAPIYETLFVLSFRLRNDYRSLNETLLTISSVPLVLFVYYLSRKRTGPVAPAMLFPMPKTLASLISVDLC